MKQLLLVLIALVLLPISTTADNQTISWGNVLDRNGYEVPGVELKFYNSYDIMGIKNGSVSPIGILISGNHGEYFFSNNIPVTTIVAFEQNTTATRIQFSWAIEVNQTNVHKNIVVRTIR